MVRFNFVITKDLREKMHLLTYTWLMTKHYNTQNDSASLSAFFFYVHNVSYLLFFFDSPVPLLRRGGPYPIPKP